MDLVGWIRIIIIFSFQLHLNVWRVTLYIVCRSSSLSHYSWCMYTSHSRHLILDTGSLRIRNTMRHWIAFENLIFWSFLSSIFLNFFTWFSLKLLISADNLSWIWWHFYGWFRSECVKNWQWFFRVPTIWWTVSFCYWVNRLFVWKSAFE